MTSDTKMTAIAQDVQLRAEQLLQSLKGIQAAHVDVDTRGRITRVELSPAGVDDRAAMRNAQSALMAVLGQNIDVNVMAIANARASATASASANSGPLVEPVPARAVESNVVELFSAARPSELHEAARVAFETLRAAQSSFHGYQLEGAELVRMSGHQYVVVALKRGSDLRCCGAAPVTDSVGSASARALMNAVGVAALGTTPFELHTAGEAYESKQA